MPKVMIVDDSAFMRNHLSKFLTEKGFETILAEDGEQAVKLYRSEEPDIVIMDITMPKMSGLDALGKIRLFDPRARVIMLTAMDQKLVAAKAIRLGAKDFLVKPVLPSKLLMRLQRVLGRRR